MKDIAIIPARGGSKRIPRKNIRDFLGKPIIAYAIEATIESRLFSKVIVSTDDEEIAAVSKTLGASIPFLRSAKNADDHATLGDVLVEVLTSLGEEATDQLCCILPTAPLLRSERLKQARAALLESGARCVVPVTAFRYPIQRALRLAPDGALSLREPEHYRTRSQDLERHFHDAGQFYYLKREAILDGKPLLGEGAIAIELSDAEVQDIDDLEDWRLAELKYRLRDG
jgi:pseudaminic acid cytidylyltransferase